MNRIPLTILAAGLALASTTAGAQTIDVSHARTFVPSAAQVPPAAMKAPASDSLTLPVITRAIAHQNSDGTLRVQCLVEPRMQAISHKGPGQHDHAEITP